jgi:hypothetical protein
MTLLFTVFENSWGLEPVMVMLVSSAKGIGLGVCEMDFGRSLMYSKKSKRPSMELCGTPSLTGFHLEKYWFGLLSIITLWNLFFK